MINNPVISQWVSLMELRVPSRNQYSFHGYSVTGRSNEWRTPLSWLKWICLHILIHWTHVIS